MPVDGGSTVSLGAEYGFEGCNMQSPVKPVLCEGLMLRRQDAGLYDPVACSVVSAYAELYVERLLVG